MRTFLFAALLSLAAGAALAQDRPDAGTIDFIDGDALIEARGLPNRSAKLGEPVHEGDTITTFAGAELHLRMADGGYLSLRENTKITLTTYRANGDAQDASLIDLAKGALRSVTGWIAKQRQTAYSIRTPMVTIGVRGTDHEVAHFEPGDPRGEPGSYDKVNDGRTVMRSKSVAWRSRRTTPPASIRICAARRACLPRCRASSGPPETNANSSSARA
jgi:hypothetical protein